MQTPLFNPEGILLILLKHETQFVVVGGMSATLQGVIVSTFDLDIVYAINDQNIQRLLNALQELDAIYRDPGGRRIVPTASHLQAGGHNLMRTNLGPLDVLGYVGTYETPIRYEELLTATVPFSLADDQQFPILDLPSLIALKEQANREKDRAMLPLLRSALNQRNPPPS